MNKRKQWMIGTLFIAVILVSGCGEKANEVRNDKVVDNEVVNSEVANDNESVSQVINELDEKRKAEPAQAPESFPLPILDGWVEGSPFSELTTGKKAGWSAEYFFEGELEDNAQRYEELLLEHGYEVMANAMIASSLEFGYIVSGHISGIRYSGSVVFDTNADGQTRVWMTFTEKN